MSELIFILTPNYRYIWIYLYMQLPEKYMIGAYTRVRNEISDAVTSRFRLKIDVVILARIGRSRRY